MVAGLDYPAAPSPMSPGVLNLTSAPNGGWTNPQHALAVYHNGYTYFTWVRGDGTGPLYVAAFNHATEVVSTPVLIDGANGPDTHNAAALLVRDSDHKLLIAFCGHNGPNMFVRETVASLDTDPTLGGGLTAPVNLAPSLGSTNHTFPVLLQLTGIVNDPIYLLYHDVQGSTGRISFTVSTDGGATWSPRTLLLEGAIGRDPYHCIRGSSTRIDILTTDRSGYGDEGTVDLGHFYIDGTDGKRYKSDGTEITAAMPIAHTELTQLETNVVACFAVDGIVSANPVFAYLLDNGDSTVTAKYIRWDGLTWDVGEIFTEAHFPVDRFFGSGAINRTNPGEVFAGIKDAPSSSELVRYTSADLGATWDAGTPVTSGSGDLNASPTPVINADASLPVIWLRGTISSSSVFDLGIRGLGV